MCTISFQYLDVFVFFNTFETIYSFIATVVELHDYYTIIVNLIGNDLKNQSDISAIFGEIHSYINSQ